MNPSPPKPKRIKFPLCEACGEEQAYSFSVVRESIDKEDWKMTGTCTIDIEAAYIFFEEYLEDPGGYDWVEGWTHAPPGSWQRVVARFNQALSKTA